VAAGASEFSTLIEPTSYWRGVALLCRLSHVDPFFVAAM